VGGEMMFSTSPNDPVFFLHHCNIDRLWAEWQARHSTEGYVPVSGGPLGHNLEDPMKPWGGETTPLSVLNHIRLGYEYQPAIKAGVEEPAVVTLDAAPWDLEPIKIPQIPLEELREAEPLIPGQTGRIVMFGLSPEDLAAEGR
jgi:hypothetical protein